MVKQKYIPTMTNVLPAKNLESIKLCCFRSLWVTNVTRKVIQFTAGTAIDKSDLATKKLLKMLAP